MEYRTISFWSFQDIYKGQVDNVIYGFDYDPAEWEEFFPVFGLYRHSYAHWSMITKLNKKTHEKNNTRYIFKYM